MNSESTFDNLDILKDKPLEPGQIVSLNSSDFKMTILKIDPVSDDKWTSTVTCLYHNGSDFVTRDFPLAILKRQMSTEEAIQEFLITSPSYD